MTSRQRIDMMQYRCRNVSASVLDQVVATQDGRSTLQATQHDSLRQEEVILETLTPGQRDPTPYFATDP